MSARVACMLATSLALSGAGCSPGDPAAPGTDAGAPAVLEGGPLEVYPALYLPGPPPALRLLSDGDPVDLWAAPQGGHVLLASAQIVGIQGDTISIHGLVRALDGGGIVAEETRTVVVEPVAGDPGRKEPALASYTQVANVPLCPDYDAVAIVGVPCELDIDVTELNTEPPSVGHASVQIVPTCTQPDPGENAFCACECGADYTLGKCKVD